MSSKGLKIEEIERTCQLLRKYVMEINKPLLISCVTHFATFFTVYGEDENFVVYHGENKIRETNDEIIWEPGD